MSMSPPGCDGELVLLNLITDLQTSAIVSSLTTTFRWARDTVARRPNILQSTGTSKGRNKGVDPKMAVKFVYNWLNSIYKVIIFAQVFFSLNLIKCPFTKFTFFLLKKNEKHCWTWQQWPISGYLGKMEKQKQKNARNSYQQIVILFKFLNILSRKPAVRTYGGE